MKTHVYILGAGASKPAGTPLVSEFFDEGFFHIRTGTYSGGRQGFFNFISYLERKHGFDLRTYEFKSDIENIISSIDKEIENGEELNEVRQEAVRFVYRTLEEAVKSTSNKNCYPDFVKKINALKKEEHVVVTFNYETLLEWEFPNILGLGSFSYEINVDENKIINFPSYLKPHENKIKILKLHGSMNWSYCPKCHKIHLFWHQLYDNIFREKCVDCGANLDAILIAPTKYKKLSDNLKKLWDAAREKIESADEISIIGYALNDYDKDAFDLIIDSIKANSNHPQLSIADPNARGIRMKIEISKNHFACINLFEGFREFLNKIS